MPESDARSVAKPCKCRHEGEVGGWGVRGLQAYPPPPHPPPRFPHQRQTSISRALEDLSSPPQPLLSPISSLPSDCRAARPVAIIARSEQWRPLRHRAARGCTVLDSGSLLCLPDCSSLCFSRHYAAAATAG